MNDQAKNNEPSKEKDPRTQHIEERKQQMAKLRKKVQRVRVTPRDDDMRRLLKHPNGMAFQKSGSVEWPLDQFTRRRIKDGSVSIEEKHENEHQSRHEDRHENHRGRAAKAEQQPEPAPLPEPTA